MAALESDLRAWAYEEDYNLQRRRTASRLCVASVVLMGAIVVLCLASKIPVEGNTVLKAIVHSKGEPPRPYYTATQFISFTINTFGGLADHGECNGRDVDGNGICYLGNTSNITEDVIHRAKIVRGVLQKIKADTNSDDPEIDHRDDVLKIFAMPEFFWRGPHGAYTTEQIEGVVLEVFDELKAEMSDEAFTHYLFVLGTVIAAKPSDATYANFCPIYKGGPTHQHKYLVTKKYISDVDFLNRTTLPNPRNYNVTEYKHKDFSERFNGFLRERNAVLVTDNVIHMDGLTIGIEICLDHRKGALWENLQNRYDSELVDVLLVTSAGMSIERGPNPVIPGGVVYLCDGTASSAACLRSDHNGFDPEAVCRAVNPDGIKHIPSGGTGFSEFFTISACIDVEIEFLRGYYSLYQTQGCAYTLKLYGIDVMDEFDYYPPSIEIYPVVDLPKNAYEINH